MKEDTDVRSYLYANKKPGDTVNLTVERNGKEQNIKVTLKEQKSSNNNDSSESESSSPFN